MPSRGRSAILRHPKRAAPVRGSNAFPAKPIRNQYDIETMRTRLMVTQWAANVQTAAVGYAHPIVGSSRARHLGCHLRLLS